MDDIKFQAKFLAHYGMRWCYDCKNFYYDCCCSYNSCNCKIYGSLDRYPAVSAMTCTNYEQKEGLRWFETEE